MQHTKEYTRPITAGEVIRGLILINFYELQERLLRFFLIPFQLYQQRIVDLFLSSAPVELPHRFQGHRSFLYLQGFRQHFWPIRIFGRVEGRASIEGGEMIWKFKVRNCHQYKSFKKKQAILAFSSSSEPFFTLKAVKRTIVMLHACLIAVLAQPIRGKQRIKD